MIFKTNVTVRYQETDQMGVAHHSVYPIWYEEARTNFIKSCLNISYSEIEKMGILLPLSKLNCKYIKPALYEDILTIHTYIKNVSSVKLEFEYKIFKNDELINTGYTEHPFVNKDFKLINLKKENLKLYNIINSAYKN
ncbi:acyl-CoA thioesterase [[Clostridium] colinum]|uniref:acyl-CoA thioesterase n=1 Tax=[Clostridium] colinum TaxID=36835 RepID=UPI002023F7D9|nr:thioesterase family protein [[Clostridium] colinum]